MQIIKPEYTKDATLLASNVAEDDYDLYDPTITYALNDTLIFVQANTHWVIRSLISGNVGNIPTGIKTDPNWVKISETNRWKMLDLKSTSQTYNNESIDVTIVGVGQNDAATFLNVDGANLTFIAKDQFGSIIYSVYQSLVSVEGIYDPYTYFFNPIVKLTDIVFIDLPPYALATYQVIISSPSSIAKCGTMLIGKLIDAGSTKYGMRIGSTDYSVKSADELGDFVITERAYSKELSVITYVKKNQTDSFINFLNSIRAIPVVWIGTAEYSSSFIYGFHKDYGAVVEYPTETLFNLEIEGLS